MRTYCTWLTTLFLLLSAHRTAARLQAFPQEADTTLKLLQCPEYLDLQRAVSIDGKQVWLVSKSRLYYWQGGLFRDISSPLLDYDFVFAPDLETVWLHVYDREQSRYCFQRKRDNKTETFPNPDNTRLTFSFCRGSDNIWVSGIVGSLLCFNGTQWQRYPGLTNNHIYQMWISDGAPKYLVIENSRGVFELFSYSEPSGKLNYIRKSGGPRGLLASGIWDTSNDTLHFYSRNRILTSRPLNEDFQSSKLIPLQANTIFQNQSHLWFVADFDSRPYLVAVSSDTTVLRLEDHGKFVEMTAGVYNDETPAQFRPHFFSYNREYSAAFGFFDGDDLLDIYAVLPTRKNVLFTQIQLTTSGREQTYKDNTVQFRAAERQYIEDGTTFYDNGVLAADFNNDGDDDLFITAHQGSNLYLENQHRAYFRDQTRHSGLYQASARWNMAAAGDVDQDGDLDIFVTREYESNQLYLNNGFGKFTDKTEAANLTSQRGGMGCGFEDIDNDGDPDLFVANWRATNRLYRNDGWREDLATVTFTDITDEAGVGLDGTKRSTSAVFGDVDNDGDMDLYVVNRTDPNRLYRNDGAGCFTDVTRASGLFYTEQVDEDAAFLDTENDGDLDLVVSSKIRNQFFRNLGELNFREESVPAGFMQQGNNTALVTGDWDNDGDVDLYSASYDDSYLYENQQNDGRFIALHLSGTRSNRSAVGTKVYFYPGAAFFDPDSLLGVRTVSAGSGLASTHSKIVHFGSGPYTSLDCRIVFPSGIVETIENISPGSQLVVEENAGIAETFLYARNLLFRQVYEPGFAVELTVFCVFLLVVFVIFPLYKQDGWASVSVYHFVPVLAIFASRGLMQDEGLTYRVAIPLSLGLACYGLLLQYRYQQFQKQRFEEVSDRLWNEIRKHQHGDWARSNLNQLVMFGRNLTPENQHQAKLRTSLLTEIDTYITQTHPSLLAIARIAGGLPQFKNRGEGIKRDAGDIYRCLEKVKNSIQMGDAIPLKRLKRMSDEVNTLKSGMDFLSREMEQKFSCRIQKQVQHILQTIHPGSLKIRFESDTVPDRLVRIPASDLTAIIRNLVRNAGVFTAQQRRPQLLIRGRETPDRVYLDFVDNGTGVAPELRTLIFQEGFTTSGVPGKGAGLAFSKQVLQKFGGNIYLAGAQPEAGAHFVVELIIVPE